ncbi:MAG: polysaccharide deacetylase family protein [Bryobacteraceae bacterium]|nr:polysaccharide deacetylase family protein [Bryobacteraceae bacterium]MDW8376837.1 polysaccharide deacetylase family protein [Bryobacterales bacterium]
MHRGASFLWLLAFSLGWLARSLEGVESCRGTLYLTIDTGSMKPAEEIAAILRKHGVRATFFLSNERTWRGDHALDDSWKTFYQGLVRDGHAFGSHTWRHWYLGPDRPDRRVTYRGPNGQRQQLTQEQLCDEIKRPDERFQMLTGRKMDPIWRAPGGRHTPLSLAFARACGYEHVGWSPAGFLGDELPSETYPNEKLLARALANLRDGDILMMHLGIRSRKEPFWPVLDPLLAGLKKKGFCFATLAERRK